MDLVNDNTGDRAPGHMIGTDEQGHKLYHVPEGFTPAVPYWSNEEGYAIEIDPTLVDAVRKEASEDARLFVDEFGEELDPAKTDWDGEAWSMVLGNIVGAREFRDELWPVYQATLVAESKRLTNGAA